MNIATIGAPASSPAAQGLVPAATTAAPAFGSALTAALQAPAQPAAVQPAASLPAGQPLLLDAAAMAAAGEQTSAPMRSPAAATNGAEASVAKTNPAAADKPVMSGGLNEELPITAAPADASLPAAPEPALPKTAAAEPIPHSTKAKEEAEAPAPEAQTADGSADATLLPVAPALIPAAQPKQVEPAAHDIGADRPQAVEKPLGTTAPAASGNLPPAKAEPENEAAGPDEPVFAAKDRPVKEGQAKTDTPKADAPAPRTDNAPSPTPANQAPPPPAAARLAPIAGPQLQHPPAAHDAVVNARPGQIGHEMGVEIARHAAAGKDELLVRLNPQEMGRIEVRMSFDDRGSLRAVVTADSSAALDMLRRDAADLNRTLADAGVRADGDSFRFNSRSGGDSGTQTPWQQGRQDSGAGGHGGRQHQNDGYAWQKGAEADEPNYRRLYTSGQVDLMA